MDNTASPVIPSDEATVRLAKVAEHWSTIRERPVRTRWWESRAIMRHINVTYCGKPVEGTDGGDIELIRQLGNGRVFERAVSVGAGLAHHEIRLLQSGVVRQFEVFEISATRADQARQRADAAGVGERLTIHVADAFEKPPAPTYDLVYWKDALHHMFDAAKAVQWSRDVLLDDGLFFMNEFVGPTHMQYSDRQLDLAGRVRGALPARCLDNPHHRGVMLPKRPPRPSREALLATDPSECADSAAILPSARITFPGLRVIPTGGIVYMLALNDVLSNLHEEEDDALLKAMMLADDLCIEAGETLYAVAHAFKRLDNPDR